MKKIMLALFILWGCCAAARAAEQVMTYQGRLKLSGIPADTEQSFAFSFCKDAANCTVSPSGPQYFPVHNGLFKSTFTVPAGLDLVSTPMFLKVTVNSTDLLPMEPLTYVPYAVYAATAGYAAGSVQKGGDSMGGPLDISLGHSGTGISIDGGTVLSLYADSLGAGFTTNTEDRNVWMGPASAHVLTVSKNGVYFTDPGRMISSETAAGLGAGLRVSTNVYVVGFSSAAKYYGDGSALYGITASAFSGKLPMSDVTGLETSLASIKTDTTTIAVNLNSVVTSTGLIQAGLNGVIASTGSIRAGLDSVIVSTGLIQNGLNGVIASTGSIKAGLDSVIASTGVIQSSLNGVIASTGVIQAGLNGVIASTGSIKAGLDSVIVSTGLIQAGLNGVIASTGAIQTSLNGVIASTGSIRAGLDSVIISTGLLVLRNGDIMSGPLTLKGSSVTIKADILTQGYALITNGIYISTAGSIITMGAGNGTYEPSARGIGSVDLQTYRAGAAQVASGNYAVISGGVTNTASGLYSVMSGGGGNSSGNNYTTVSGGNNNTASAQFAVVSGGQSNTASGSHASIPGGNSNAAAGQYSFAAGNSASSGADGAFTWADSAGTPLSNPVADRAVFKSRGGFLVTGSTNTTMSGTVNRGVFMADGKVGISTGAPQAALDVVATGAGLNNSAQIWRDSSGVVMASMTATGVLYANAAGLTNVRGDGLGNHIATATLHMAGFAVVGSSSVMVNGPVTALAQDTLPYSLLASTSADTFHLLVTTSGWIGMGTNDPKNRLHMEGDNHDTGMILDSAGSYDDEIWNGPWVALVRSRGSHGNQSLVQNADPLGGLLFLGYDGHTGDKDGPYQKAAVIRGVVDGTAVLGSVPGKLEFYTSPGAAGLKPRMTIQADGKVGISTGAPQAALDLVAAGMGLNDSAQIWRDSSGAVVASMTATGVIYASAAGLTNVPGDGLGSHTATRDLDMKGFVIIGVSSITTGGSISIGTAHSGNSGYGVSIGSASYNNYTYGVGVGFSTYDNYLGGVGIGENAHGNYDYGVGIGNDNSGNNDMGVGIGNNASGNSSNGVGIGSGAKSNSSYGVGIGDSATGNSNYGVGIGASSKNNANYATAVGAYSAAGSSSAAFGYYASAAKPESLALGAGAKATAVRSVCIGAYCVNGATGTVKIAGGYALTADYVIGSGGISAGHYEVDGSTVLASLSDGSLSLGLNAGKLYAGDNNVFAGSGAGNANLSGTKNSILGFQAGYYISIGSRNSLLGYQAGQFNKEGVENVAVGYQAGSGTGAAMSYSSSTAVGYMAGYSLAAGGSANTFLGWKAGYGVTTGTGNIVIGYNQDVKTDGNNQLNIGGVIYGNMAAGKVGISTAAPVSKLQVAGGDLGLGDGTNNGNQPVTVWLNASAAITVNQIVVISAGNTIGLTTVVATTTVAGIAYETCSGGTACRVAVGGVATVMNYSGAPAYPGQHVCTSGEAGRAQGVSGVPVGGSSIGIWLENVAANGSGRVLLR